MTAKNLLVTGRPGIGKTTCVQRTAELLVSRGVRVGGMITLERREGGVRVGFEVRDVAGRRVGTLASVGGGSGPRIGRYVVNLADLESVGVGAIERAMREAQVILIDEIGPMELLSRRFVDAVFAALDSPKPVLATIHVRAGETDVGRRILSRSDVKLYTITLEVRERLPYELAKTIASLVSGG
ncbi:MAG: NTPase [Thermofilum sp.]